MHPETHVLRSEDHVKPVAPAEADFLDSVISYIPEGKARFHWDYLPGWLRRDVMDRYHDSKTAKAKVNAHIRFRKHQARWPVGWWERVDPDPLFRKLERAGKLITPRDRAWLEELCETAKRTHRPPNLDLREKRRLEGYTALPTAFELMGLPYFKHDSDLKAMLKYWRGGKDQ